MQITSPLFLFCFIPLALLSFHLAPVRLRSWVLLLFSVFFYLWGELVYAAVLGITVLFSYLATILLERAQGRTRNMLFGAAVALNLLLLAWFKYSAFMLTTLTVTFGLNLPFNGSILPDHLPMGISFFTFLAISYLVDVWNETCPASRNLKETALYFLFFPKVTAGPLTRFGDFSTATASVSLLSEDFSEGVRRFITGLARKVLLATPLMKAANAIFDAPAGTLDMPTAWLGVMIFALQIYHDFAGYSDMAVGLGRMFGYKLPENFDYPYSALSFTDFWRRWHITLSSWLRDYLFFPLSRLLVTESFRERLARGKATMLARTCLALCLVFTACGVWHGAGWNFILWGLAHGLFLSFEQTAMGKRLAKAPVAMRRCYLLGSISLTWVFFRIEPIKGIAGYFRTMITPAVSPLAPNVWTGELLLVTLVALLFSFPLVSETAARIPARAREILLPSAYVLLLLTALAAVASGAFNPFIYARF
jgi:alginate O-acetyltransferase complex protein AlgI